MIFSIYRMKQVARTRGQGSQALDIVGYDRYIIVELMPSCCLTDDGSRNMLGIQSHVRERHGLVIRAMIEEYPGVGRQLVSEAVGQAESLELPLLIAARIGRSDQADAIRG